MTSIKLAILFCVLLVQKAASQAICQPELYISIDELLRAISNGQGNANQQSINFGQDVCGCNQPSVPIPSQNSCGFQQSNSLNQQLLIGSQPSISFGNQGLSTSLNQQSCGCGSQQPFISIGNQPSIALGNQGSSGFQPSIQSNQQSCGCGNQQSSLFVGNQPSISFGNQGLSGYQPSIPSNQQSCGCDNQQPSLFVGNQPSISFGNQGCQQSISLNSQQPSFSIGSQATNSLATQQSSSYDCSQSSISTNNLGLQLGYGNQQSLSAQPTLSLNNLLSQQSYQQSPNQPISLPSIQSQQSSNQCGSQLAIQSPSAKVGGSNIGIFNIGSNVDCCVPNALLQAPPFGIFFEGENLIIDGAVLVCGTMPFNSAVQISGVLPASGLGNVQYVCNDIC